MIYFDKLPTMCRAVEPSSGDTVQITLGQMGYRIVADGVDAKTANEMDGITPGQVNAMVCGSMFGWGTEGTNPDSETNKSMDPYEF